jgi:hypothetical protein
MQPFEMRRAADSETLHRGGPSRTAERFGERIRIDARPAETRTDEKNDRPIAVVLGQFVQQVVEGPFGTSPSPAIAADNPP